MLGSIGILPKEITFYNGILGKHFQLFTYRNSHSYEVHNGGVRVRSKVVADVAVTPVLAGLTQKPGF